MAHDFLNKIRGKNWINGIPHWCPQYQELSDIYVSNPKLFVGNADSFSFEFENGFISISVAVIYFGISVCWLCMMWSAASLGTPTQPDQRDRYLRPLIIFQLIAGIAFPLSIFVLMIMFIHFIRTDNYRCGQDVSEPDYPPDDTAYFLFHSVLLVTYALELIITPSMFVGKIVRFVKKQGLFVRGKEEKEHRLQYMIGLMFRIVQCMTCGKMGGKEFKNKELKDFAVQFVSSTSNESVS